MIFQDRATSRSDELGSAGAASLTRYQNRGENGEPGQRQVSKCGAAFWNRHVVVKVPLVLPIRNAAVSLILTGSNINQNRVPSPIAIGHLGFPEEPAHAEQARCVSSAVFRTNPTKHATVERQCKFGKRIVRKVERERSGHGA